MRATCGLCGLAHMRNRIFPGKNSGQNFKTQALHFVMFVELAHLTAPNNYIEKLMTFIYKSLDNCSKSEMKYMHTHCCRIKMLNSKQELQVTFSTKFR